MLNFFQRVSTADGARESPVARDSSSVGAGSDVGGVAARSAGVRGGGASEGSDAEVVATGVMNGLEDCEGAGSEVDGVFPDAADEHGPTDMTCVHAPILCAGMSTGVREPVLQHYPSTLHGVGNQGVSWEARIYPNRISVHAVATTSRGILSPGCAGTAEQPGGTCEPCLNIKFTKAYRGEDA